MSKASIMVVEDSRFFRDLLAHMLLENDQVGNVITCSSAMEALETIGTSNPDLVLLNIILPDMIGFELCRQIKALDGFENLPIIFLTSSTSDQDLTEGFEAGAVDYVHKPFKAAEINARVRIHLDIKRMRDELYKANLALTDANKELLGLSRTDPLTQLANRRHVTEMIEKELNWTQRYHTPFSVIILDIDHFKRVNDTYGHNAGDMVLQELAAILTGMSRKSDLAARWGGEEFLMLLTHTDRHQAFLFAQRIKAALADLVIRYQDLEIRITATMGIAEAFPNCTAETLVALADSGLYYGKETSRNVVIDAHTLPDAPQPDNQAVDLSSEGYEQEPPR